MKEIIRIDLGGVNAYLIKFVDGFVLVDTGGYTFMDKPLNNRTNLLEEKIIEYGFTTDNLKLIFLTHGDIDHIGNCHYLKQKYGTKIMIHRDDLPLIKDLSVEKIFSNFKFRSLGLTIISKLMNPLFVKISKKIVANYKEFEADEIIDGNFDLKKYKMDAEILHLPGHTKGSIGLLFPTGDLIVGDTLANNKKPKPSINALDFKLLDKSILSLKNKNIKMVHPGHGDPFLFSDLKLRRVK